jgi:uncharacterized protein DUF6194
MDEASVITWISEAFDDVERTEVDGNSFFFYDPEHKFPFATLVTSNLYDHASDLERPGVYRLNVGIGRETWTERFGPPTKGTPGDHGLGSGSAGTWDFTALDVVMPHPVYGRMHWVCVLNPSEATFETVKPLLSEAYDLNVARTVKRGAVNANRPT